MSAEASGLYVCNSPQANFRIQMLVKVEMQGAFQFGRAVHKGLVFLFKFRFAKDDSDTLLICTFG